MTTSVQFAQAKDPDDAGVWYAITWPKAVVQQVLGVAPGAAVPMDSLVGGGSYNTPGDLDAGAPLVVGNAQLYSIAIDGTGQATAAPANSVAFQLSGGVPGNSYPVRAQVKLVDGSVVFRSAILEVTGR